MRHIASCMPLQLIPLFWTVLNCMKKMITCTKDFVQRVYFTALKRERERDRVCYENLWCMKGTVRLALLLFIDTYFSITGRFSMCNGCNLWALSNRYYNAKASTSQELWYSLYIRWMYRWVRERESVSKNSVRFEFKRTQNILDYRKSFGIFFLFLLGICKRGFSRWRVKMFDSFIFFVYPHSIAIAGRILGVNQVKSIEISIRLCIWHIDAWRIFLLILNACQKRKKKWKKVERVRSEIKKKKRLWVEFGRFKVTAIELNDSKSGNIVYLNRLPQHS